jgi:pilus assembly protein TadC
MNLSLTYLDLIVVFSLVVVGVAFVVTTNALLMGLRKRRAIEEFLDYVTNKVKTEEEFNEIVNRLRKDFE